MLRLIFKYKKNMSGVHFLITNWVVVVEKVRLEQSNCDLLRWLAGWRVNKVCSSKKCDRLVVPGDPRRSKKRGNFHKYEINTNRIFSVVFIANYPRHELLNTTYRKVWIDQQVDYALNNDLGIFLTLNFEFCKTEVRWSQFWLRGSSGDQ